MSSPFIGRPVGTTLLTIALALSGAVAYRFLPVSPLPQVDFPTISVSANLPGASPETMASAVATPLERQMGRIAGITEMTSQSALGSASVTLQFDLSRNIDAAARDVQAAINASRSYLPADLPSNPTYRKQNPADAPILILSLTSSTYSRGQMYDAADTILAQKLSQVEGVGTVTVGGGASPAVRVDVNPTALNNLGLSLEDVRNSLNTANALSAKGQISGDNDQWTLESTDQLNKAVQYRKILLAYRNGAPVRLSDVANVTDSVADVRNMGIRDGKPAVLLIIFRQPAANIIDTVDRVMGMMSQLQAEIPANMHLEVMLDRTTTIRASVHDTEFTLMLSVLLVVLVVFIFLRDWRTTLIPSVAVPVSLIGTLGVMYLAGYSIDNLSLMALTIATGFVVDDAIVVIENITRHLETGMKPMEAALLGASEIGFTVVSISISLVAVFIPLLMMGGIIGRLFREFAVTLSVAIGVSMIISLTTTPMMCAYLLKSGHAAHGKIYNASEKIFDWILGLYRSTLAVVLNHPLVMLVLTLGTVGVTIMLYIVVPKALFPQQDIGQMMGNIVADQDTSFDTMSKLLTRYSKGIQDDPDVAGVMGFCGGGRSANTANMFITLVPIGKRKDTIDDVRVRLSQKLSHIPGATLYLQAMQDLRFGGRSANAQYQYTLQGDSLDELNEWAPKVLAQLQHLKGLQQVNSDQQNNGLETMLTIDRPTGQRLGITPQVMDNILNDAYGQREVSTMYNQLNQYHVVLEIQPNFLTGPHSLDYVYIPSSTGKMVPLSTFASFAPAAVPLTVNHQSQFPAVTISFNLEPGFSLGTAVDEIAAAERKIGLPDSIHGGFAGNAQAYQSSVGNLLLLIIAAIVTVYIVLGMLYESLVHPITILSTIPSAGVGALIALIIFSGQLDVIGMIGIILLIGIVKKNAIMMIDFALEAERNEHLSPKESIFKACILRFRPITMTTMAAALGGLPLAVGSGNGAELRRPLGIAIVGGLMLSQLLTLYTTPVIYLYLDRMRLAAKRFWSPGRDIPHPLPAI